MKKRNLYCLICLLFVSITIMNIQLTEKNSIPGIDLKGSIVMGSAHAEGIGEWWNAQIYDCVWSTCLGFIPYSYCTSGNSEAHCWNCVSCN